MKTEPNESAYPIPDATYPNGQVVFGSAGLTKREYFAALVLAGLQGNIGTNRWSRKEFAEDAVKYADALINELNKENQR